MKLPGGEDVVIDARKVSDYILNSSHPRGRHKARVFLAALELVKTDAKIFISALRDAAATGEAVPGIADVHGQRYVIDFLMSHKGRSACIRSSWILGGPDPRPRFVTAFVET